MKNLLILLAIVLVAAGAYWKFRDKIHGKIEDAKKADPGGSTASNLVDAAKSVVPPASGQSKAGEKLPLVDAEFIRRLPDSLTGASISGTTKSDLVVEVTAADESSVVGLPAQIQLTRNVWLDTSGLALPGVAKEGTMVLVHLQSIIPSNANVSPPQYVVQCVGEPVPQPLEAGLRRERWRIATSPAGATLDPSEIVPYLWATEFVKRGERNELHGVFLVEGTFGGYQRASGNAPNEVVTLEEAKNVKFYFGRGSSWKGHAEQAERLKKEGNRVTLKMNINVDTTPKFTISEMHWSIPIKDQMEFWRQLIGEKKRFGQSLGLAAWAETRGLSDEARAAHEKARGEVVPEAVGQMGRPTRALRIHLSDEVDDQWFHERVGPVSEFNHHPIWKGRQDTTLDFFAIPNPFCATFKTNPKGEATGDYYLLNQ